MLCKFEILKPRPNGEILEPEPRSGHRVVADEANLYSIGGYNPDFWGVANDENTNYPLFKELWRFNLVTRLWEKLTTTGPVPSELASHSALLHGNFLLVYGGTGVPFGDTASNKVHVCNLKTLQWRLMKCCGEEPIRAYGQSIIIHEDELYVFGGTTGWDYNCELHKLNLNTAQWTAIEAGGEPPDGRYRHEVVTHDNKMFVLGGGRSTLCYGFEKIPVFNFDTQKWSCVPTVSDDHKGFPSARRCHACCKLGNDAYICGGYNGLLIHGDIWRLSLDTMRWSKLSAVMPEPVYFHSATVSPTGCILVYGGVTQIDDIRTSSVYRIWVKPPTSLKELCWYWITRTVPNLHEISAQKLVEIGVPENFVSRIVPQCSGELSSCEGPSECG